MRFGNLGLFSWLFGLENSLNGFAKTQDLAKTLGFIHGFGGFIGFVWSVHYLVYDPSVAVLDMNLLGMFCRALKHLE